MLWILLTDWHAETSASQQHWTLKHVRRHWKHWNMKTITQYQTCKRAKHKAIAWASSINRLVQSTVGKLHVPDSYTIWFIVYDILLRALCLLDSTATTHINGWYCFPPIQSPTFGFYALFVVLLVVPGGWSRHTVKTHIQPVKYFWRHTRLYG